MQISLEIQDGAARVRVNEPRIDAAAAIRFKDRMREFAGDSRGQGPLILDLSEVNFIDSSGLGAIVAVMKFLAPSRKLELAGLTPNVEKLFRLTRMDSVFTIHASVPERKLRDAV